MSALVTCNGDDVISAALAMPRCGVWQGWFRIDVEDAPATGAAVSLDLGGGALVLSGTGRRSGLFVDQVLMRMVGGAGGLPELAAPKFYGASSGRLTVAIPVGDLLKGAGETLSSTADQGILGLQLASWSTLGLPASRMLSAILEDVAPLAAWRILPDGTVWLGAESWPTASIGEYTIEDADPALGVIELAVDAPLLQPGTVLEGQRISRVEHRIDAHRIHTTAYVEPG